MVQDGGGMHRLAGEASASSRYTISLIWSLAWAF